MIFLLWVDGTFWYLMHFLITVSHTLLHLTHFVISDTLCGKLMSHFLIILLACGMRDVTCYYMWWLDYRFLSRNFVGAYPLS